MKVRLIILGVLYVIALILMAVAYSSCWVYKYSYDGEEYRTKRQVRKAMEEKTRCKSDTCRYGKSTRILDGLDSSERATIQMKLND